MAENRFRERRSAFTDEKQEQEERSIAAEAVEAPIGMAAEAPAKAPPEEPRETRLEEAAPDAPDPLAGLDLPAASFLEIVQYFAIQAIQFLGEMPLNEAGERRVMPREAKHFIDLLGILEERTRGNLSDEESRFLEQILSDLRMRYLQVGA